MIGSVKAIIVIVLFALLSFWLLNTALRKYPYHDQIKQFESYWLLIILAAALIGNFWIFSIVLVLLLLIYANSSTEKSILLYAMILCVLPLQDITIPGIGEIQSLFDINYSRILCLSLLLPIIIANRRKKQRKHRIDYFIITFVAILSALGFRDVGFSEGLRNAFIMIIDVLIPYYAISRLLDDEGKIEKFLVILFIGISPFALIGMFETVMHWLLYSDITARIYDMDIQNHYTGIRGGSLRALALFNSPIVLGYVMVIAAGLLLYLKELTHRKNLINIALIMVVLCLLATKSRGPWVGLVVLYLAYLWTGRDKLKKITMLTVFGTLFILLASFTSVGSKYISMLPIIGSVRQDTLDYRAQLIEKAWIVFKQNPFTGTPDFLATPEMQSMRQGQGIIDLVNSFVQIVLPYGLLGLFTYIMIFYLLLRNLFKLTKEHQRLDPKFIAMSRALFATLLGMLFVIATMSSIDYVPIFIWTMVGLISAFIKVGQQKLAPQKQSDLTEQTL